MKNWLELLVDASAIRAVYQNVCPSIADIDLHELVLHRDGPRVLLRFDLPVFPAQPPKKWLAFNRVQLRLVAVEVCELEISGLRSKCVLNLSIVEEGALIRLTADNGEVKFNIAAKYLMLDSVSAYRESVDD